MSSESGREEEEKNDRKEDKEEVDAEEVGNGSDVVTIKRRREESAVVGEERKLKKGPATVEFATLQEAVNMPGMRVTMVPGAPGIYPECLKNICYVKQIPITRVIHPFGDDQALLYELTSQKSTPTMFYNDERPRNVWSEQLALAEEVGTGPSLIPEDFDQRTLMFGLLHATIGQDGFMWNKRLLMAGVVGNGGNNALGNKYGYSERAMARAPAKVVEYLAKIDCILQSQQAAGSNFLIGNSLTALDIYLATALFMVAPPGEEILPVTEKSARFKDMFLKSNTPEIVAVISPRIEEFRDFIISTFCECPIVN